MFCLHKILKHLIVLTFLLFPLSGCWSRVELNDLAITMGMAIDITSEGRYRVAIQVVDSGEVSSSNGTLGRSPVVVFSAQGNTITEAMQRLTSSSPKTIFNGHLRVLVISEKLARKGIENVLDYISRDRQFRTDFPVVIAKNNEAESILKILTPLDLIPAKFVNSTLHNSEKYWAPTMIINFEDLISTIITDGVQPVVSGIDIIGNTEAGSKRSNLMSSMPANRLKLVGLSVFNKDRLVGWLNEKESRGFNIALGNTRNATGNVMCPDGKLIAVVSKETVSKLDAKPSNGKLELGIKLAIEGDVSEVACDINLTDETAISTLEKSAEDRIENIIHITLDRAQKDFKSDIFGFGEKLHKHHPAYWRKVKDDWDAVFADAPVTVDVDVKLRLIGTVTNKINQQ